MVTRARLLCWLLCLLFASPASVHALSGGPALQLEWDQLRDGRMNRTRYAGPGVALGGYLSWRAGTLEHVGQLWLGVATLDNRFDYGLLRLRYALDYALRVPVARLPTGPLQLVAGVAGGSRFGLYFPEDPEHIHWNTLYSLSLGARAIQGAWSLQLTLPLVGVGSRPPLRTVRNNDKPRVGDILPLVHGDPRACSLGACPGLRLALQWRPAWARGRTLTDLTLDYQHLSWPAAAHLLDARLSFAYLFGQ